MNIPQLQGIVDLVALQTAVGMILLSDERLEQVPILPEIKLLAESDQQVDVLWTLPKIAVRFLPESAEVTDAVTDETDTQPPTGCGLLVEMPTAGSHSPAVTGPALTWEVSVVAFEEPNTNFVPDVGIGIMAEQLSQLVMDILHLQAISGFGTLQATPSKTIEPAQDWMTIKPGIKAWRATFRATIGRTQTARATIATAAFNTGICTLTCADATADIYYVLNGTNASMPVKANPQATKYVGPFPVLSGDRLLVATFVVGKLNSEIIGYLAP